jgi:hypothetical protein
VSEKGRVVLLIDGIDQLVGEQSSIQRSSSAAVATAGGDSESKEDMRLSSSIDDLDDAATRGDAVATALNWLPMSLHPQFRVITSATPGPFLDHLTRTRGWFVISSMPLAELFCSDEY